MGQVPETPLTRALRGLAAPWAKFRGVLAWLGALALCAALAALWGYSRGRGSRLGELARVNAAIDSLKKERARVDTIYRVDSVKYAMSAGEYRTLRDSLRLALARPGLTDVDVRELAARQVPLVIGAADRALEACSVVLRDCDRQRALADSLTRVIARTPVPRCEGDRRWGLFVGVGVARTTDGETKAPAALAGLGIRVF